VLEITREIHARHATATDFTFDPVPPAERLGNRGIRILDQQLRKPLGRGPVEHRHPALAFVDEALDFGPKLRIAPAHLHQHRRAMLRWCIEDSVHERREPQPSVGQQRSEVATRLPQLAVAHGDSARRNNMRAFAQSR